MLRLYAFLVRICTPAFRGLSAFRVRRGKDIQSRLGERYGIAGPSRPKGKLVWFHAASNGEALSALPLIEAIRELPSAPTVLVTTMTVTAARLMDQRLPEGCIHQFIPYDHPQWINRFHDHWQPDAVFWIESELWPNHLTTISKRKIPAALLNTRLSDKSTKRWGIFKGYFKQLLSCFTVILAQTERDRTNLLRLGIETVNNAGNLKEIALPLPYDPVAFNDLHLALAKRDIVIYASTHDGEEAVAVEVHKRLKHDFPNIVSIIIPRHPVRGEQIVKIATDTGLIPARRSLKMSPRHDTDIYIADTLGELGLFYRLGHIVFVGNSLNTKPGGGHNLLEPALLDCAIVTGPDLHNFSILADQMPAAKACTIIQDTDALYTCLKNYLQQPEIVKEMADNAYRYATDKQAVGLGNFITALDSVFQSAKLL